MRVRRKNIAVCIILCLLTCNLYSLYWLYTLAEDVNTVSGERNDASGAMVLILTIVTCSIYGYYWSYRCGEKINKAHNDRGEPYSTDSGILYLILYLLAGIVTYAVIQHEVNKLAE